MSFFVQKAAFELTVLWRHHRVASAVLAFSIMFVAFAVTALMYAKYEFQRQTISVTALEEASKRAVPAESPPNRISTNQEVGLQKFNSRVFTSQFHQVAVDVGLPIEEVSYSFEESDKLPYLRYRVTMTVKARYTDVRKFIAALASTMAHVSLDSIRCMREAGIAQPLSCDLAFSAFFLKV